MNFRVVLASLALFAASVPALAQQIGTVPNPMRTAMDQKEAVRVNDAISIAYGFGNTFMVTTRDGNVIIDTSNVLRAPGAKKLLTAVSTAPVKYIILTHAHGDHTGGVPLWKEGGTQVIAQREEVELLNYQTRLERFFQTRNSAQFAFPTPPEVPWAGDRGAKVIATKLFDDTYEFKLGGVEFKLFSTPGETPDHLTVWVPKYKAAFVGDNYYDSFPNMYTLRGTKPRWALDYIDSLNKVLALEPEIVLPSHGEPIRGKDEIKQRLTRYRDAIQYVHDAVVRGMNAGKDVYTLMREIKLPHELEVGESYGNLVWSIRGIYEGYAGWFDLNPSTMYDASPLSVAPDLAKLAGGADAIAKVAQQKVDAGQLSEALRLTDVALAAEPANRASLEVRLTALQKLLAQSKNGNEAGWLQYAIREVQKASKRE